MSEPLSRPAAAPRCPRVAVVTDSTACLTRSEIAQSGIRVVPLRVLLGHRSAVDDGQDVTPADVTRAHVERSRV